MPGHDSKGSVEESWAALGAELDAKEAGQSKFVPNDCWATPEDGWAALAAELDAKKKPTHVVDAAPPAIPSFEEFQASQEKMPAPAADAIPSFEEFKATLNQPSASAAGGGTSSSSAGNAIPSFEEFKASANVASAASAASADLRMRDPSEIERGWSELGAEIDGVPSKAAHEVTHASVEDGWAALGAELDAAAGAKPGR